MAERKRPSTFHSIIHSFKIEVEWEFVISRIKARAKKESITLKRHADWWRRDEFFGSWRGGRVDKNLFFSYFCLRGIFFLSLKFSFHRLYMFDYRKLFSVFLCTQRFNYSASKFSPSPSSAYRFQWFFFSVFLPALDDDDYRTWVVANFMNVFIFAFHLRALSQNIHENKTIRGMHSRVA